MATATSDNRARGVGRPADPAVAASGDAMRRLIDGEPATLGLLAVVAGISYGRAKKRVQAARRRVVGGLSGADRTYLARQYRRESEPAVREWLADNGINPTGRRRAHPDRGGPAA